MIARFSHVFRLREICLETPPYLVGSFFSVLLAIAPIGYPLTSRNANDKYQRNKTGDNNHGVLKCPLRIVVNIGLH